MRFTSLTSLTPPARRWVYFAAEVPAYAKTAEGKVDWTQADKQVERTEFYKSMYNARVKLQAELKMQQLFSNVEARVVMGEREIKKGDTLGKILLELANGDQNLLKQGLNNLQGAGFQVDLIYIGDKIKVENNKLTVVDKDGNVRKDRDTGTDLKGLKVFDVGATSGSGPGGVRLLLKQPDRQDRNVPGK